MFCHIDLASDLDSAPEIFYRADRARIQGSERTYFAILLHTVSKPDCERNRFNRLYIFRDVLADLAVSAG